MNGNKRTILIIEDEKILRGLLVTTLRGEGYSVYEAENGRVGLKLVRKVKPELVLLDIIMPEMDGIEMLKRLRRDDWGRSAQVVLLTNLGDKESIKNASGFGIRDYLVKSDWSLDELSQRISKYIS